jgi:hypothetical protein
MFSPDMRMYVNTDRFAKSVYKHRAFHTVQPNQELQLLVHREGNSDFVFESIHSLLDRSDDMFEEQLDLANIRENAKEIASGVYKVKDNTFVKVTLKSQGVDYTIVGVSEVPAPSVRAPLPGESCPLCYDDFSNLSDISKPDEQVVSLTCSHKYHRGCIEEWINLKGKCPYCTVDAIIVGSF